MELAQQAPENAYHIWRTNRAVRFPHQAIRSNILTINAHDTSEALERFLALGIFTPETKTSWDSMPMLSYDVVNATTYGFKAALEALWVEPNQ